MIQNAFKYLKKCDNMQIQDVTKNHGWNFPHVNLLGLNKFIKFRCTTRNNNEYLISYLIVNK